ncbi:MAG: ABC transporter substrate-binding protein [Clostridium sp.]
MMKNINKSVAAIISVIMVFAFTLSGCALTEESNKKSEINSSGENLHVIRMPRPTGFMTNIVADAKGFFEEEGVKLEFVGDTGKVSGFQLIEQNLVDCIYSHPDTITTARLQGVKVKGVAPDVVDNEKIPHVQYIVNENSSIKSLDDVGNAQFAINSEVACYSGFIKYYLKTHGIEDNVNWVILSSPGQGEQSVVQNQVEVVAGHPPYAGKILNEGGVRRIGTSWDIFHSPGTGLYMSCFSEEFIKNNPEAVQGYCNAMYKTRLWVNTHLDEAKEIVSKFLNLDTADISSFYYDENKNIDPDYVNQWFELCESIDLWKHGDIDPDEIYTNDFVPKDQPELEQELKEFKENNV